MNNSRKWLDAKLFALSAGIETVLAIFLPFDITGFEGRKVGFPLAFTTLEKLKYSSTMSRRDIDTTVFMFDVLCIYFLLYCIKCVIGRIKDNGRYKSERK